MKLLKVFVVAAFLGGAGLVTVPTYARNVDGTQGMVDDELKAYLGRVAAKGHKVLGYKNARKELMGNISLQKNSEGKYFIHDVYCEKDFTSADFGGAGGPAPGRIPNANVLNTEHTWPQSKFGRGGSREGQKSDLHHLFPTDNELNSDRGNIPLGEVEKPKKALKCPVSKAGDDSHGTYVFEPPQAHKGNAARALFYFSTRYGLSIDANQEEVLRKWNQQDPVDQDELDRNDAVEKAQGNRNPYVDDPTLVDRISNF